MLLDDIVEGLVWNSIIHNIGIFLCWLKMMLFEEYHYCTVQNRVCSLCYDLICWPCLGRQGYCV